MQKILFPQQFPDTGGAAPATFTVSGTVYDQWIEPMAGIPVMAFDKDIRSEHLLGEAETGENGQYSITYTTQKLTSADNGAPDIIVRAYDGGGNPLQSSPIYYNAGANLSVNINLGPRAFMGPSEFVRTLNQVRPFIGKLAVRDLTENKSVHDLSFLIDKTGIAVNILLQLVASFRFEKWTGLEAEVYYGILSYTQAFPASNGATNGASSLPADVDTSIEQAYISFWSPSVTAMINALQQAAINNTITYSILKRKEEITATLRKLKNAPPQEAGSTQSLPTVYTYIQAAGLTAAQQQAFLNLYRSISIGPAFCTALANDPNFQGSAGTTAIGKLQALFHLATWTGNNAALSTYITQTYSINAIKDFSGLVSKAPADWVSIIQTSGSVPAGSGQAATVQSLANSISAGIEELYPTAVLSDRFSKAGTFLSDNLPLKDVVGTILSSPDFNVLNTNAFQYLGTHKLTYPQGVTEPMVGYQIMAMQRVYKISSSADTSMLLLGSGIQSARQIYAMGPDNFVNTYQEQLGGETEATAIFYQAEKIQLGATFLTGQLISFLNNPAGNFTVNNGHPVFQQLAASYPDLANVFDMGTSYCECKDCRSFLGTPAYLTDLLDYLYQLSTPNNIGGQPGNVREVLLANGRRPDITDIELSCKNANVELPYIDVVNELLEDYIIPPVATLTLKFDDPHIGAVWSENNLQPGPIQIGLFNELQSLAQEANTPICNISLLTMNATLSATYTTDDYNYQAWAEPAGNTTPLQQLVIRDEFISLKLYILPVLHEVVQPGQGGGPGTGGSPGTGFPTSVTIVGLIVQEIHQTHLSAAEISSNPEYTNTNVYNCLSDPFNVHNPWRLYPANSSSVIPMSLPFDLYFTEANVYLQQMGKMRYDLINTFRAQEGWNSPIARLSLYSIVDAYLGLAPGDSEIIFTARLTAVDQSLFWGSLVTNPQNQAEVDLFLTASGLSFTQLQTLLTLVFINPNNDSAIAANPVILSPGGLPMENCNTAGMYIANMTPTKYDHINRFLRLWNKVNILTTVSMTELDQCIQCKVIGDGYLNEHFGVNLYYFLQVMNLMSISATQALVLYQDMGTTGRNSLYQQLFQNRQISNPLVAAFDLPLAGNITDTQANPGAIPVILAACGITQNDLTAILNLNSGAYTALTIDNLSFIYACGLLSNALSISVSDLLTFTSLVGFNRTPQNSFDFIAQYNAIQAASFTVDGINYLLTNQSTASPSLIPNATAVTTGLQAIRTAIQAAVTATTVVPDPQGSLLKKWLADPALNWDPAIAAQLMSILATAGTATFSTQVQNNLRFLQLLNLQYEESGATAYLDSLPAISFPDQSITGIKYDATTYYLFYYGTMSDASYSFLQKIAPQDAATQGALKSLYLQSLQSPVATFALAGASTWVSEVGQSVPAFSGGAGVLGFTGVMTAAVYTALLAQSDDPTYRCALSQLFIVTQSAAAGASAWVPLAALPAIGLPDSAAASLSYNAATKELSFTGAMSAADALTLLGLATDSSDPAFSSFQTSICTLYNLAAAGQTATVALSQLPAALTPFPDISSIGGLSFSPGVPAGTPPALCFTGQMGAAVETALEGLSSDPGWKPNIVSLYQISQSTVTAVLPVTPPAGTIFPPAGVSLPLNGVSYAAGAGGAPATLSYTGSMSDTILELLLAASTDAFWATTITALYQMAQGSLVSAVQFILPSPLSDQSFNGTPATGGNPATPGIPGINSVTTGSITVLSATGQISPAVNAELLRLSNDATYVAAIGYLFAQTSAIIPATLPTAPLPIPNSLIYNTAFTPGYILFTGTPNPDCMDEFNLQQLNPDPAYTGAVAWIYSLPPVGSVGSALSTLPPISLPTNMPVSWSGGELGFVGQMQGSQYAELKALSNDLSYQAALSAVNAASQIVVPASQTQVQSTMPLSALPPISIPSTTQAGYDAVNGVLYYSGPFPMPSATQTILTGLSVDFEYQAALALIVSVQAQPAGYQVYAPPPLTLFSSDGISLSGTATIGYIGGTIGYPGIMSFNDFQGLLALSDDPAYMAAISGLYVASQLPAAPFPLSSTALRLPSISFPAIYASQVSYSQASDTLTLRGYLTAADQAALLTLADDSWYQQAINRLYQVVNSPGQPAPAFFPGLYEALWPETNGVLNAPPAADLYGFFLSALNPVYQPVKEATALASQIAALFALSVAVATDIVADLNNLFTTMTDPAFAGNSKTINPDPNQCAQALWYMKLARIAYLVNQFNLSAADTDWLLKNGQLIGAIDFTAYPSVLAPLRFDQWEVINNVCLFQRSYKHVTVSDPANPGETIPISVYSIISAADELQTAIGGRVASGIPNPGALLQQLVLLTGWSATELSYLLNIGQPSLPNLVVNPLGLRDTANPAVGSAVALNDISILLRLSGCFTVAKQMKVAPSRCVSWITDPLTDITATDIKQALKAQFPDAASWQTAILPLTNTLRQARRDALLAYLVSNQVSNVYGVFNTFTDTFAVYGNFLLDVEMAACQATTRIIQAYCSIQLFVQRCLLSLEPAVTANSAQDEGWTQWTWMGTYEGWSEARNIFLFPENVVLPQTLPNPTSLFTDMQNDLNQGPVTTAVVESAFENYLESLDEVARLQVRGMWYDETTGNTHVFACTYGGNPEVYYYRILDAQQQWSPWELVTADISGDQIIPVVQNGRVYLYWPVFTQTSDDGNSPQNVPSSGGASAPPNKYWKIQMAFSEYKNGQWTGKKISKDYLYSGIIAFSGGSPVCFPDTTDFVFIALDIPPKSTDVPTTTLNSIETNNKMGIACYQYSPCILSVSNIYVIYQINGKDGFPGSLPNPIQINVISNTISLSALVTDLNAMLYSISHSFGPITLPTNGMLNTMIPLNSAADPGGAVCDFFNGLNATITVTPANAPVFTAVFTLSSFVMDVGQTQPKSDSLQILTNTTAPALNSFLLDPLRGYPTAADLRDIIGVSMTIPLPAAVSTIPDLWFQGSVVTNIPGSTFENNLVEGSMPLTDNNGVSILQVYSRLNYANLLSLQMGLWAKYQAISNSQLNVSDIGVMMPFFYQDKSCTFYVRQGFYYNNDLVFYSDVVNNYTSLSPDPNETTAFFTKAADATLVDGPNYQFINFYHPFAPQFMKILARYDVESILTRPIQLTGDPNYVSDPAVVGNLIVNNNVGFDAFNFNSDYSPGGSVDLNFPIEQMDFTPGTAYSQYNWELFFHGVLMSAMALSQNQQFEDADTWFKMIFNPADTSSYTAPQKYWVTKPFFENTSSAYSIAELIFLNTQPASSQSSFWQSVAAWRNDPYDPHMLALSRITPYMYCTFMQYLDNLISWANYNYQQYTMETVNIAIQLFLLAQEMLGPEPQAIPPVAKEPTCTYNQLESNLDSQETPGDDGYLSDPIVQVENLLPPAGAGFSQGGSSQNVPMLNALYFCIPPNEVLLGYWTTVQTQLNKINNCMNIQGQFQPLSPFPSVPGMINADGSGVSDFGGVLPNYRFTVMIQKAAELCNEVKSLGSSLLSALEKQDAEGLALLRASQEIIVQQNIDKVKQLQITDAQLGLQNLQNYLALVKDKIAYYSGLVQGGLIPLESAALTLNNASLAMEGPIMQESILASIMKLIPNLTIGTAGAGGTPEITASFGGAEIGGAIDCFVQYMSFQQRSIDKSAAITSTLAGYARRMAEWQFQLTLANDEKTQVTSQISAAQNKIAIATQDEANQQTLIQNAEDIQTFLQNKYTNQQLYSWMVTQISNVYFKSYQLAYSWAKQAEVCWGYELGITGSSYIQYGYWDSLHKGLLSGEGLMSSLKQMEADYYTLNIREYELTRQISLAQLDPAALLQLKSHETCFVNIPEELFDLDYPGHYFRRIKHVAITIPGVTGPYTPVCLTMTLMSNSVRIDNTAGTANNYPRNTNSTGAPANDSRFLDNVAAIQYIATSTGVNDSGLFEMNLHDERYLPFERAGAISTWQLEFSGVYPQFDPASITDLIVHFSYTARDGGPSLQAVAAASLQNSLKSAVTAQGLVLMRGFSARRDFPTQWYKFLNPGSVGSAGSSGSAGSGTNPAQLTMDIGDRFPFFTRGLTIRISQVVVVADLPADSVGAGAGAGAGQDVLADLYLSGTKLSNALLNFGPDPDFGSMQYSITSRKDSPGLWAITNGTAANPSSIVIGNGAINDLYIIFYYSLVNTNPMS